MRDSYNPSFFCTKKGLVFIKTLYIPISEANGNALIYKMSRNQQNVRFVVYIFE